MLSWSPLLTALQAITINVGILTNDKLAFGCISMAKLYLTKADYVNVAVNFDIVSRDNIYVRGVFCVLDV